MGFFLVRNDSRVVNYDRRGFVGLAMNLFKRGYPFYLFVAMPPDTSISQCHFLGRYASNQASPFAYSETIKII